jgi:tetratricopeptide (TPR) repeat protein
MDLAKKARNPYDKNYNYGQAVGIADSMNNNQAKMEALKLMAKTYLEVGDVNEAMETCEIGISLGEMEGDKSSLATFYRVKGDIYSMMPDHERAMDFFNMALAISQEHGDINNMAWDYYHIGEINVAMGEVEKGLDDYNKALELAQKVDDAMAMAILTNNIALVYMGQEEIEKARDFLHQSLAITEKSGPTEDNLLRARNLAYVYARLGDEKQQYHYLDQVLNQSVKVKNKAIQAEANYELGQYYSSKEETDKAIGHYKEAVRLGKSTIQEGRLAAYYNDLAVSYGDKQEYQKAIHELEIGVSLVKKSHFPDLVSLMYSNLGFYHEQLGLGEKAIGYYGLNLQLLLAIGDEKAIGEAYNKLGMAELNRENFTQAKKHFLNGVDWAMKGMDKKSMIISTMNLGILHDRQFQFDEALDNFHKALSMAREIEDARLTASSLFHVGQVLYHQGNYPEAMEKLGEAEKIVIKQQMENSFLELFELIEEVKKMMGG